MLSKFNCRYGLLFVELQIWTFLSLLFLFLSNNFLQLTKFLYILIDMQNALSLTVVIHSCTV